MVPMRSLAAVALLLLPLGAACESETSAPGDGGGGDKYALRRSDAKVVITDVYRPCGEDADCVLVDVTCNGCCSQGAVRADLRSEYEAARSSACADYQGAICDCQPEVLEARCVGGQCRTAPPSDDAGATADASADRSAECAEINRDLKAELAELQACDTLADCGKLLPSTTCGCTRGPVGRLDADTTELTRLLARRGELSDVEGCESLDSTCDCPAVAGVACVDHTCTWLRVSEEDACHGLDGAFTSKEQHECGLGPDGVVLCAWSLNFGYGTFDWQHSDVAEAGSYSCAAGVITAMTPGGTSYQGTISADGSLLFDGVAYAPKTGCPRASFFGAAADEPLTATQVELEQLCAHMSCPQTLEELLLELEPAVLSGALCEVRRVSGCGVDSVYQNEPMPMLSWHYDGQTGLLIGASRMDDVFSFEIAGCQDATYQAGEGPGPCSAVETTQLCTTDSDGAGND